MQAGYVQRAIQLKAAVKEAERVNRPLICWPEDVGHIKPADLPKIDLKVAEREFAVIEREWRGDDAPLSIPTPGKAYAVVNRRLTWDGPKSEVVTFRTKTADECKCDEDRESNLWTVAREQESLIRLTGETLALIAEEFIAPDISIEDYPEIDKLLDAGIALRLRLDKSWERVVGNERSAGTTE